MKCKLRDYSKRKYFGKHCQSSACRAFYFNRLPLQGISLLVSRMQYRVIS